MRHVFEIPDELRSFLRDVSARLYWDHDRAAMSELRYAGGRGGWLVDDVFEFTYVDPEGHRGWAVRLDEKQIHGIASGTLTAVPAQLLVDREPLLVWGPHVDDALRVCRDTDLATALDALFATGPCMFRLWSITGELIVAALDGNDCALHLVQSTLGYGTSVGDPGRAGNFEVADPDAGALSIPRVDSIAWWVARSALLNFAEGRLEGVMFDPRLSTKLFAFCALDHASELAVRRLAPWDPALSSLPRRIWHGAWAKRVLDRLSQFSLLTLDDSIRDVILARVALLLLRAGENARDALEPASELLAELGRIRGITLIATPHELQAALRHSAPPPPRPSFPTFELTTPPVV